MASVRLGGDGGRKEMGRGRLEVLVDNAWRTHVGRRGGEGCYDTYRSVLYRDPRASPWPLRVTGVSYARIYVSRLVRETRAPCTPRGEARAIVRVHSIEPRTRLAGRSGVWCSAPCLVHSVVKLPRVPAVATGARQTGGGHHCSDPRPLWRPAEIPDRQAANTGSGFSLSPQPAEPLRIARAARSAGAYPRVACQ